MKHLRDQLRAAYDSHRTRALAWRREQLNRLDQLLTKCEGQIFEALRQDLGKAPFESYTTEIALIRIEIRTALSNLSAWTRKRCVGTPIAHLPASSYIIPEPRGVVLILGPWNYPIQLTLSPLVGAIAAGNCAAIKPSEMTPHSSTFLAELIPQYLDVDCIQVAQGDAETSRQLLKEHWDHIFFTGSQTVGKMVMHAAAENLTSLTLELGGKCPCIVDEDVNVKLAAKRIAWGKFTNAGQTCIAPDYLLVHERVREEFLIEFKHGVREFFGDDPKSSPDFGRIVNERHVRRLAALLEDQKVASGGIYDVESCYFAPTVVLDPDVNSPLMQEEIFGPILPVLSISNFDEAIQFVNARPTPLTLYCFSNSSRHLEQVERQTSSGALTLNDTLSHIANPHLPFGGVGPSGMGQYHGVASFRAFSHMKPVFSKSNLVDVPVRYAPRGSAKLDLAKRLM